LTKFDNASELLNDVDANQVMSGTGRLRPAVNVRPNEGPVNNRSGFADFATELPVALTEAVLGRASQSADTDGPHHSDGSEGIEHRAGFSDTALPSHGLMASGKLSRKQVIEDTRLLAFRELGLFVGQ
jgi:hypothetical protein